MVYSNIGADPTTNWTSSATYAIMFQMYSCIIYLKSRGISGVEHVFKGNKLYRVKIF